MRGSTKGNWFLFFQGCTLQYKPTSYRVVFDFLCLEPEKKTKINFGFKDFCLQFATLISNQVNRVENTHPLKIHAAVLATGRVHIGVHPVQGMNTCLHSIHIILL